LGFPRLNVACGPIIEQAIAKNIICRFADRHAAAQVGRGADECTEFEFKIQTLRRAEAWRAVRAFALAVRSRHGEIADTHRGGTAVIGDRQIFVVWRQGIIGPKQPSGIGGVEDRSKEVGEIAKYDRHPHFGMGHRRQVGTQSRAAGGFDGKFARQSKPQSRPRRRTHRHQRVEKGRAASLRRRSGWSLEQAGRRGHIDDLVTDRHADPRLRSRPETEDAEREILNRKIGSGQIGALDKTAPRRIVGFVEHNRHGPGSKLIISESRVAAKIARWAGEGRRAYRAYGRALRQTRRGFSQQPEGTRALWPLALLFVAHDRIDHIAPHA
jgi:hypothetical protein